MESVAKTSMQLFITETLVYGSDHTYSQNQCASGAIHFIFEQTLAAKTSASALALLIEEDSHSTPRITHSTAREVGATAPRRAGQAPENRLTQRSCGQVQPPTQEAGGGGVRSRQHDEHLPL